MAPTSHADSLRSESPGKSRGRSPKWPLPWTTSVLGVELAPKTVTSSRYVLRGCPRGLLSLWEQAGLIQDVYNCCLCAGSQSLLELPCPFQQWNVFCALGFKASPVGPQSQDILAFWGFIWRKTHLWKDFRVASQCGAQILISWGELLQFWLPSYLWVAYPWMWVLSITYLCCSCPFYCGSFFIPSVTENLLC